MAGRIDLHVSRIDILDGNNSISDLVNRVLRGRELAPVYA